MKKNTVRSLARLLVCSLMAAMGLLATSPAKADSFTQANIFNPAVINEIDFNLPAGTVTSLSTTATAKTYAPATVSVKVAGWNLPNIAAGVRLKGSTSLELLNQSPSFKVAFDWAVHSQRLVGLKNLTLNAMTQDTSQLHEWATYKLANAFGIPAPRTGWALVKVNGVSKGLYVVIESYDDVFTTAHFKDVTQHLYEAAAFGDLKPGHDDGAKSTGWYQTKVGWSTTPNKADLTKLISAANITNQASWWTKLATVTDRTELIKFFALENFAGQWDGYSGPTINNHFLRSNTAGKFTFMPWGADQTWGENRQTTQPYDDYFYPLDTPTSGFPWVQQAFHKSTLPRGLLFQKCLAYKPCKTEYLLDLKAVSAKATAIKLVAAMKSTASILVDYGNANTRAEQQRTEAWVGKQQVRVAALLKLNKIK